MQLEWHVVLVPLLGALCLGLLWRLAPKLLDSVLARRLWRFVFRFFSVCGEFLRNAASQFQDPGRVTVFSAETLENQEAEFVDEHPPEVSTLRPWLVWFFRALLLLAYFSAVATWLHVTSGRPG